MNDFFLPVIINSTANSPSFVASTLASGIFSFLSVSAAFEYSGAKSLQCPHLLIKNCLFSNFKINF